MHVFTRADPRRALVVPAVAALALAACGEAVTPQSPTQRVQSATSSVFDTESLTVSFGLDLDDTSSAAIAGLAVEELGEADAEGGPTMTAATVERLLGSRIVTTMATTDGSKLSDIDLNSLDATRGAPKNVSSSVSFLVEGDALIEMRQVAGVVYARVDTAGLETALAQRGLVDDITAMTEDAPPALAEGADALASGEWVSLDTVELLAQMEELAAEVSPTPSESTGPDTGAMTDAVKKLFSDAVDVVTREIEITEKGDDAYTVTAPLDRILSGLTPSLKTALAEIIAQTGAPAEEFDSEFDSEFDKEMAKVTESLEGRKATLDVTLDGDRLSTIRMDVAQFLDEADRKEMTDKGITGLPVLVELVYDGEVQTPEGAVRLDLANVMEELMDSLSGLGDAPVANHVDGGQGAAGLFDGMTAEDFGMTEEEFEAFKAEMGVKPTP